MPDKEYFLDQDEACHWYLVPVRKREAWDTWVANCGEEIPSYASPLDGHPNGMIFTKPRKAPR